MSQTKSQVSKLLTNVSLKYTIKGTIADKILPLLMVKQTTGIIGDYGQGYLRQENDLMGGRGEARRVEQQEYKLNQGYHIKNHGLETVVTPDDYENVEEPFDAEVDETDNVTSIILINKEIFARNTIMNPAVVTQNVSLTGNQKFSDRVNSDPLGVAKDAKNATLVGCGFSANAIAMSKRTYHELMYHPQILGTLGFAMERAGKLSIEDLKKAFDVEYIEVGEVAYNSAKQGQSDTMTQVWGSDMLFYYRPEAAAKRQVSFGYQLRKMSARDRQVYKYGINNPPDTTGIIAQDKYDYQITNAKAGYLVQGTF